MAGRRHPLSLLAPELEAIYSDRNAVPFDEAFATDPAEPWWRCEDGVHGHEWQERTSTRRNLGAKWKQRSVLACPFCAGILLRRPCGHVTRHQPGQPGDPKGSCSGCFAERYDHRQVRWQASREQIDAQARSWLDELDAADCPPSLMAALKKVRLKRLRRAAARLIVDEDVAASERLRADAAAASATDLLPKMGWCLSEPAVAVGDKMAWGPGIARFLGHVVTEPTPPDLDAAESLSSWFDQCIEQLADDDVTDLNTSRVTRLIEAWVYSHDDGRQQRQQWRKFRELTVPVVSDGRREWGRVDLVVRPPEGQDVVIEIDQDDNPGSVAKLAFARACGAVGEFQRSVHGPGHDDRCC